MFLGELGQENEVLAKLSSELERQADIYKDIGVNKDAIMRLLAPRPEGLPEYLRTPVVTLGTSVDLARQAQFANITNIKFDLSKCRDACGGITFKKPHLIWMQDGEMYVGKTSHWAIMHLYNDNVERLCTIYDGLAYAIVHPDIRAVLRSHCIDLPGTRVGGDASPCLSSNGGHLDPYMYASIVDVFDQAGPLWGAWLPGSATCSG
jgi:hypothetical protein